MSWATFAKVATGLGSLISGGANIFAATQKQYEAPQAPNYDWEKALEYSKKSQQYAFDLGQWGKYYDAIGFKGYADAMGVSPYALLGNAPSSTVAATPIQPVPEGGHSGYRKLSKAEYFAKLGQDIQRGVNSVVQLKEAESMSKLRDAETRLKNEQAAAIRNQTQLPHQITEENLPSETAHPGVRFNTPQEQERSLVKPYLHAGIVRHLPKEGASDFLSEDWASKTLFYKDRLKYAQDMNHGHNVKQGKARQKYLDEKARLEWYFKRPLKWDPTVRISSDWFSKDLFGAWVEK